MLEIKQPSLGVDDVEEVELAVLDIVVTSAVVVVVIIVVVGACVVIVIIQTSKQCTGATILILNFGN